MKTVQLNLSYRNKCDYYYNVIKPSRQASQD